MHFSPRSCNTSRADLGYPPPQNAGFLTDDSSSVHDTADECIGAITRSMVKAGKRVLHFLHPFSFSLGWFLPGRAVHIDHCRAFHVSTTGFGATLVSRD
jgi:hypothetical protein